MKLSSMGIGGWLFTSTLLIHVSRAQLSSDLQDSEISEIAEQCEIKEADGSEDTLGHALLASKVKRTVISGSELPVSQNVEPLLRQERLAAIEQLRTVVAKQQPGETTQEQWQQLLDLSSALLSEVRSDSVVKDEITHGADGLQPFRGDNDPLAARDRHDYDYIRDGSNDAVLEDDPLIQGPAKHEHTNATLGSEEEEVVEKKILMAKFVVVPLAAVFFFVFTVSIIMEKNEITWLPESAIMIAVGVFLGFLMKMYTHFDFFQDAEQFGEMNSAILNLILLPIIMFASGWAVRRQDFYSQFPYILMFAMGGVGLSTVVIACLINWTGSMGLHFVTGWRTAFAYASLISATDPVATLSTYAKLKVDPLLNIIVFGESVINDAVAIVLFNVFNSDDYMVDYRGVHHRGSRLLLNIFYGVFTIFLSSVLLGIGLGMIYTLIAHWADARHNKKGQILNICASCYLTYALAESFHMSGIIATMFAGLLMGVYMKPHLSQEGSALATFFVKQLAMLADCAVCLLIGVSVVQLTTKGWRFGLWTMLFCLVGRAFAVFPVGIVCNSFKRTVGRASGIPQHGWNLLSPQHMFMMWHAGLRGAIALALSLELGKWVDVIEGKGARPALQTATFLLIVVFLLVFGGTTQMCLDHLGIETGRDHPPDYLSKTEDMGPLRGFFKGLDKNLFAPILLGDRRTERFVDDDKDVEDMLKTAQERARPY